MNVTDLIGHVTMIDHVETMDVMTDVTDVIDDSHLLETTDQFHQIGVNSPARRTRPVVNHDVWMEVLEAGRIGVEAGYQVRITRTPAHVVNVVGIGMNIAMIAQQSIKNATDVVSMGISKGCAVLPQ